jgi:cell division protein FtsB
MATTLEDKLDKLARTVTDLTSRIQDLEDTNAIRKLHHAYGYYIDKCIYTAVVDLFSNSPNASVHFLNGI